MRKTNKTMFIEERYEIEINEVNSDFEFTSIGKNGEIRKVVQFRNFGIPNAFNLGFGDKDLATGNVDDKVVTDNGDFKKVLATVAATAYTFTEDKLGAVIIIRGSNKARVRLYQIAISKYLERISEDFVVYGFSQKKSNWEIFNRNSRYKGFMFQRKNNIL